MRVIIPCFGSIISEGERSGTGLGLSLSYDIVKAHGGELNVQTNKEEGPTFTIQLPIL
jgi:signal transduction histidine kinase